MQVYPNRFSEQLNKGLQSFYLIFGDEPQQKLECIELIRQQAREQGFDERQSLTVDNQFQWQQLIDAFQTMSLFSSRQLIELTLPDGKAGAEGSKVLAELADKQNPDTILVIHGDKIGRDVQNTKWFKALDKAGVYVPCYPLEGRHLQQWINDRLRQHKLSADPSIVKLLADYSEGNLLAARQEIDKLPLVFGDKPLELKAVQQVIGDHSRYTAFQLADVLLAGDLQKAVKMLYRLESEGAEPVIILWALVKEWQTLSELHQLQQSGKNFKQACDSLRIWANRQSLYQQALQRLSPAHLAGMQSKLTTLDTAIKQSALTRPYVELCHICLLFGPADLAMITPEYLLEA